MAAENNAHKIERVDPVIAGRRKLLAELQETRRQAEAFLRPPAVTRQSLVEEVEYLRAMEQNNGLQATEQLQMGIPIKGLVENQGFLNAEIKKRIEKTGATAALRGLLSKCHIKDFTLNDQGRYTLTFNRMDGSLSEIISALHNVRHNRAMDQGNPSIGYLTIDPAQTSFFALLKDAMILRGMTDMPRIGGASDELAKRGLGAQFDAVIWKDIPSGKTR